MRTDKKGTAAAACGGCGAHDYGTPMFVMGNPAACTKCNREVAWRDLVWDCRACGQNTCVDCAT